MKHEIENKKLVFHLEGELNSYNAEAVEAEIEKTIEQSGFVAIVWDI